MSKLKKKIDYEQAYKMLRSPDAESVTLGLGLINEHDFKTNIITNLLLWKTTDIYTKTWEEHADYVYKNIMAIMRAIDGNYLTYKNIFEVAKKHKVDPDQLELYLKVMNNFLLENLKNQGYDYIESLDLKLNFK